MSRPNVPVNSEVGDDSVAKAYAYMATAPRLSEPYVPTQEEAARAKVFLRSIGFVEVASEALDMHTMSVVLNGAPRLGDDVEHGV